MFRARLAQRQQGRFRLRHEDVRDVRGRRPGEPAVHRPVPQQPGQEVQRQQEGGRFHQWARNSTLLKGSLKKSAYSKDSAAIIKTGLEILKLNPWDISTLVAMAEACDTLKYDEAELVYLKQALNLDPKDAEVNRKCGRTLARRGEFDQAIACWHRVEQAKPGDEEAAQAVADLAIEKTISHGGYEGAENSMDVMADKADEGRLPLRGHRQAVARAATGTGDLEKARRRQPLRRAGRPAHARRTPRQGRGRAQACLGSLGRRHRDPRAAGRLPAAPRPPSIENGRKAGRHQENARGDRAGQEDEGPDELSRDRHLSQPQRALSEEPGLEVRAGRAAEAGRAITTKPSSCFRKHWATPSARPRPIWNWASASSRSSNTSWR